MNQRHRDTLAKARNGHVVPTEDYREALDSAMKMHDDLLPLLDSLRRYRKARGQLADAWAAGMSGNPNPLLDWAGEVLSGSEKDSAAMYAALQRVAMEESGRLANGPHDHDHLTKRDAQT